MLIKRSISIADMSENGFGDVSAVSAFLKMGGREVLEDRSCCCTPCE